MNFAALADLKKPVGADIYRDGGEDHSLHSHFDKCCALNFIRGQWPLVNWMKDAGPLRPPLNVILMHQRREKFEFQHLTPQEQHLYRLFKLSKNHIPLTACPHCDYIRNEKISPFHDPFPTYQCLNCAAQFHFCPTHKKSIRGANPYSLVHAGNAVGDQNVTCTCPVRRKIGHRTIESCFV